MYRKKTYTTVRTLSVALDVELPVLGGSIINNSTIQVMGQDVGKIYDFSSDPVGDEYAGKHFNHEWVDGSN